MAQVDLVASSSVDRLASRITSMPKALFLALCLLLLVARDGFWLYASDWDVTRNSIASFPEAVSWQTYSWGNIVLAKALGVDNAAAWYGMHILLTVLVIALPVGWAWRRPAGEFHLQVVFWFLVPVVSSLFMWIGMYDVVFVLGLVTVAFSRRWYFAIAGALIMSAGNPEQALVAAAIYVILTIAPSVADRRRHALTALLTTGVALIPVLLWQQSQDASGRASYLNSPIQGMKFLIQNWPHSVWAWFGILWLVVACGILAAAKRDRWILLLALVVLPGAVTLMVNDWNRVFWLMSTLPLLVVGTRWAQRWSQGAYAGGLLILGLVALAVSPTPNGGLHFALAAGAKGLQVLTG